MCSICHSSFSPFVIYISGQMFAFVTVGSTKFDALVQAAFSKEVLCSLHRRGYTDIVVQCGNSAFELASTIQEGQTSRLERESVSIEFWKFKQTLQEEYYRADLVISHAGSGTILDVLRLGKAMIIVPNPTLLDNHQEELAEALSRLGHLKATTVINLAKTIDSFEISEIVPFPPFDGSKFAKIVDEEMGFI